MDKKIIAACSLGVLLSMVFGVSFATTQKNDDVAVDAYSVNKLPTTIDLNAPDEEDVRDYYSNLTLLNDEEKTGLPLLAGLKNILKNNQKYYAYDGDAGDKIWQMYEITDRDWILSPAEDIASFNPTTKIIENYQYGSTDPYIHALYVNRDVDNQTTAHSDHQQTQWGINREHVWPKSQGFNSNGKGGARGDPMHLMAGNGRVNGVEHNDHPYGYVDTTKTNSKSYTDPVTDKGYTNLTGNMRGVSKTLGSGTVFEPQDSDKGDIARSIFYMVARYNYQAADGDTIDSNNPNLRLVDEAVEKNAYTSSTSVFGEMGILSDLLEWNHIDPPDEFEIRRNNLLYVNYTNNRNPFIDFPDWADIIWGDKSGDVLVNPDSDTLYDFSGNKDPIAVEGVELIETASVVKDKKISLTAEVSPRNATNKRVTWTSSDESIATVSKGIVTGVAVGTATITVTTLDGEFTDTCEVSVVKDSREFVVDTLSASDITYSSTSGYCAWSTPIEKNSGVVYSGASCYNTSNYIQLTKHTTTSAGIITTTSPGIIRKITVEWDAKTAIDRKLYIYEKNSAYSSSADLYNDSTKGTNIEIATKATAENFADTTSLTFDDGKDYQYLGFYSPSAVYLSSIILEWEIPVQSVTLDTEEVEFDLHNFNDAEISATVLPANASNKDIIWVSNNEEIAHVDSGVITPIGVGATTVIAKSAYDETKFASCEITVIDTTPAESAEEINVNKTLSEVAIENNWVKASGSGTQTCYPSFKLDDHIIVSTTGTPNCGSFWGSDWRLYQNKGGDIIVSVDRGYVINTLVVTYGKVDNGVLLNESEEVVSGEVCTINSNSITYTVGNSNSGTNGKVKITSIDVTYSLISNPDTAESYAYMFLNSMTCDNAGRTGPIFTKGHSWTELETMFLALPSAEKTILSSSEEVSEIIVSARARYDYIVAKYTSDVYEDFMNRNPVLPSQNINNVFNITKNNDSIIYIIVFASLTGLSFLLYLGIRKKED